MYDKLNMIYVEIPKFKKENTSQFNHLEWWMYVFQNLNKMTDIPQELHGDVIAKAFEKAEFIKLPKEEQDKYHRNLKIYRDLLNSYNTAHKTGVQEGIKQRNREIVQKLLEANMSIEFIVEATGLSIEEIERLV